MKLPRQPITYILPEKTARRIKLMAESANMSEADFITILAATECMTKYPKVEREIEKEFEDLYCKGHMSNHAERWHNQQSLSPIEFLNLLNVSELCCN